MLLAPSALSACPLGLARSFVTLCNVSSAAVMGKKTEVRREREREGERERVETRLK